MGVLQNVIREIGDIVNRLSVSSKEKQKIQEEIQSLVYRYKSELVREQAAAVGEEARGNWLQRSWRPIVMLAFASVILSGMFMESTLLSDSSRLWDLLEIGISEASLMEITMFSPSVNIIQYFVLVTIIQTIQNVK